MKKLVQWKNIPPAGAKKFLPFFLSSMQTLHFPANFKNKDLQVWAAE